MATGIDLDQPGYDENGIEMHRSRRRMLRRLVQVRKERGHEQKDVAEVVGVSRSTVSRFEHDLENSNPTLDTVLRYAHAVGVKLTLEAEPLEEPTQRRAGAPTCGAYDSMLSAMSERLNESYFDHLDVDLAWVDAGKHVQPLNI